LIPALAKFRILKDAAFVSGYDFVNDRVEADEMTMVTVFHVAGTIAQSTASTAMASLESALPA